MTDITDLRRQLAALQARLDELEAREPEPGPRRPTPATPVGRRRALIGLAGMAAAGAAAAVAPGSPAAAADGDPLLLGEGNQATSETDLVVAGGELSHGLLVADSPSSPQAARGLVTLGATTGDYDAALSVHATDTYGVVVDAASRAIMARGGAGPVITASCGAGGIGLLLQLPAEDQAVGLVTVGPRPVHLQPSGRPDPVEEAGESFAGELRWTGAPRGGTLWACVASSEDPDGPSAWRALASADTAGSLHLLPTPVRAYDSRPGSPPATGPKEPLPGGYASRTVGLAEAVPAGATGALVTVQLVGAAAGNGNLTLWAGGRARPQATTLVWGGDAGRFTTQTVTALGPEATVQVASSLPTHVVLDVVGYYR